MNKTMISVVLAGCLLSASSTDAQMQSRWAKDVNPAHVLDAYPRPQLARKNWTNLNGTWQYAITGKDQPPPQTYQGKICVPFPIESALSGVKKALRPEQLLWYKRNFKKPAGESVWLHFGAVDWQATVFINGKEVGKHTGGYTAFSFDITDALKDGENELVVKVYDPTDAGYGPHGKQVLNPASIYYTASSGIWQTVWLESLPAVHIQSIKAIPDIDQGLLQLQITATADAALEVTAMADGKVVSRISGRPGNLELPVKMPKLWSPEHPFLYDLVIRLKQDGKVKDEVRSYFGMRKISIGKDEKGIERIFLNNKPYFNFGTLDQGFWPDGLYTAPTDEALTFDIKAIKAMGFNTIRKHIKVEPARWYYHADKEGMLVWQDFVNPNHSLPEGAKAAYEEELRATIAQLQQHPSIITWVVFNERWGAYDQQRITGWVKQLDPTRLVNGHSGEYLYVDNKLRQDSKEPYVGSDMTDVHAYPDPMNAMYLPGKVRVLGEFGGIGVPVPGHQWDDLKGWGYVQVSPAALEGKYAGMVNRLVQLRDSGLSASIYTQPFDVEGEENGLMTYDREIIKIPLEKLLKIHAPFMAPGSKMPAGLAIGRDIDKNDTDDRYLELKNAFEKGQRDSAFLRRLTLMAIRKRDQPGATRFGNAYVASLKALYSSSNLAVLRAITRTTQDTGFSIFREQAARINAITGESSGAERKVMSVIAEQEIKPYSVGEHANPDWEAISRKVRTYGALGEEILYAHQTVYYLAEKDWARFGEKYKQYFERALGRSALHANNMSWYVFERVNDPEVLALAIKVMKYDLEHFTMHDGFCIDTYANLLYKAGRKKEAIEWEEKALRMLPDEQSLKEALAKMKAGQPTWPQN